MRTIKVLAALTLVIAALTACKKDQPRNKREDFVCTLGRIETTRVHEVSRGWALSTGQWLLVMPAGRSYYKPREGEICSWADQS